MRAALLVPPRGAKVTSDSYIIPLLSSRNTQKTPRASSKAVCTAQSHFPPKIGSFPTLTPSSRFQKSSDSAQPQPQPPRPELGPPPWGQQSPGSSAQLLEPNPRALQGAGGSGRSSPRHSSTFPSQGQRFWDEWEGTTESQQAGKPA